MRMIEHTPNILGARTMYDATTGRRCVSFTHDSCDVTHKDGVFTVEQALDTLELPA